VRRRRIASNSTFTAGLTPFNLGPNATTFDDSGLSWGVTYYYRIQAFNGAGSGVFSPSRLVDLRAPGAPTGVVLSTSAPGVDPPTATLTWTCNAIVLQGFTIERATNSAFTNPVPFTVASGLRSFTDNTGLARNTVYWYRIRAFNGVGVSTWVTRSIRTAV
jgi:hypothetical protein